MFETNKRCAIDDCPNMAFGYIQKDRKGRLGPRYRRICREHNHDLAKRSARRSGDRWVNAHGYIYVRLPDGTSTTEHRVVMSQMLGRPLTKSESVHHKDGDRANNNPENLELWVGPMRYGVRASDLVCPHCNKRYYE